MFSIPLFSQDRPNSPSNGHTTFDILLGKEKSVFNHPGNKRFRAVVNYNVKKYVAASTKTAKTKFVRKLHQDMKKSGFRFLKKKKVDKQSSDFWHEIEESDAREKVSHALRDRVRELRKPVKRRRRSHEEVSPMIFSISNALSQNHAKNPLLTKIEPLQEFVATSSPSTHMLVYPSMWSSNQEIQKQSLTYENVYSNNTSSSESFENSKGRLRIINMFGSTLMKNDRDYSLRSGAKRRGSQLGVDDTPRKLPSSLCIQNSGQGKKGNTNQSRRASLESLFNGMANEVADVQPRFYSPRDGMFGSVPDGDDKHCDMPFKYFSKSNFCEKSSQSSNLTQPTETNRRLSMTSLFGGFDQGEDGFCSAKCDRRLSMLSFSFGDFSQSCNDHDHEQLVMPDRRMSMVGLSLEGFSDNVEVQEDFTEASRRLSILSSFNGFNINFDMLDSSKHGRRVSLLSCN